MAIEKEENYKQFIVYANVNAGVWMEVRGRGHVGFGIYI